MRGKKTKVRRVLALCMTLFMCIGAVTFASAAEKRDATARVTVGSERIADDSAMETWEDITKQSTQHTGRIWTDKSVFTDGVTLPGSGEAEGGEDITVEQGDSDFLIGLSALSSTSNMTTQSVKPLDIVLVLDTSGSMDDGMSGGDGYAEIYTGNLDTNKTYYIERGGLLGGYREVTYNGSSWGYETWSIFGGTQWETVTPKTNAGSRGTQFYYYEGTRLDSMKNAVNQFIDSTAEENEDRDENTKHQLSIVTYASSANTRENLQEVTADTAESLKNTVNNLSAFGATQADEGMANANEELESIRGRDNAQQVVIFFTDGSPTSGNQFEASVANGAVREAGEIKSEERGGLVYSIGIFEGADPDDNGNENRFMNAVSSNYPNATAYNSLGDRAEDGAFYKTARETAELEQVFTEIFEEIKNPGNVPTHVGSGDPMNDGYITIEDELGAYMEVDGFNEIVFADREFTRVDKTTRGNTDTYTFTGRVDASELYPNANLNEIVITVERAEDLATGDKVTVKIPAALIPLRQFDVQETDAGSGQYTTDVTNTYPMRIFFGVSLKEDAAAMLENPDLAMSTYMAANTGGDGKVNFYSNDFTKDAKPGKTTATFTPAGTNNFYYFAEDTLLYTDENCTTVATRNNSGSNIEEKDYWYQRTYYEKGKEAPVKEIIKISGDLGAELLTYAELNGQRQWYVPAEAPRLMTINNTHLEKGDGNRTNTAADVIDPQWVRNESNQLTGEVAVYLGNNGKLAMNVPGILEIVKNVTAEEDLTAPDEDFTFKIDLTPVQGGELKAEYKAQKFDKDGNESGEEFAVTDNGTVKLKAGERIRIYGLDRGTQYSVAEENLPEGFTQTAPANDAAMEGVIGTGADNGINKATFTNTYEVEEYTIKSVDLGLKGTKTIKSDGDVRTFKDGDIFRFDVVASQQTPGAPLPTNATDIIEPKSGTTADISFGDFTFDEPGQYRYSIREYLPNGETGDDWDKIIPGITYDPTEYRIRIRVDDNGNGELIPIYIEIAERPDQTGTAQDWTILYEDSGDLETGQAAQLPGNDKSYLDFVNTWNAEEQSISFSGKKTLDGKSLGDYTRQEQFGFKLEAGGVRPIGDTGEFAADTDQPMPNDPDKRWIYRNSTTGDITISGTAFKTENVGKEYKYILKELQPTNNGMVDGNGLEGAEKNDDGKWVYKGITFDNEAKEIIVRVNSPDGTNEIQAQVIGNNFEFVNSYDASVTTGRPIKGTKKITGRDFKAGDEFTFKVEGLDGAPLPKDNAGNEVSSVTINPDSGKEVAIDFGKITFTQADMEGAVAEKNPDGSTKQYTKEFTYKFTEMGTDTNGIVYDKTPKTVTIKVTDDNHGNMQIILNDSGDKLLWNNIYRATGIFNDADLEITKVLEGRAMRAGEFHFTVRNEDGTPTMSKSFANEYAADGTVQTLNDDFILNFDEGDVNKDFIYIVDETEDIDAKGITYDKSQYRVTVTPKDDGDGTITPAVEVTKIRDKNGNQVNEEVALQNGKAVIPFENEYSTTAATTDISAGFTKAVTGRDWKEGDEFTFNITGTADDGSQPPMPKTDDGTELTSVTVDYDDAKAAGAADEDAKIDFGFGEISFDETGEYTYEITEDKAGTTEDGLTYSNNIATVTVNVEDKDHTGTLTATPVITSPDFVNTYSANLDYVSKGSVAIFKTLHGTDVADSQFSFTVTPKDKATSERFGIPMEGVTEETDPATEGQRTEVARIQNIRFTEDDAGKTYTLTVKEADEGKAGFEYDDTEYTVEIAVSDLGSGKLQAVTTVAAGDKTTTTTWDSDSPEQGEPIALDFENYYNANATAAINLMKELNGKGLKAEEFSFRLMTAPIDGSEPQQVSTAKNDKDGKVAFAPIKYATASYGNAGKDAVILPDIVGKYAVKDGNVYTVNYTAVEDTSGLPADGISATKASFPVTVKVKDNGDGTLNTEVVVAEGDKFINTYATDKDEIPVNINGIKKFNVEGAGLTAPELKDNFSFNLKALNGGPMPTDATAKTDEQGNIDFGEAVFKADMLDDVKVDDNDVRTKEFKYEVTEVKGDMAGVTYDTAPKTFTITLKDDGKGHLTATPSVENAPLFEVVNTYKATSGDVSVTDDINIKKVLDGRDMKAGEFKFELVERTADGEKVAAAGTNDKDGNVTFEGIEYKSAGTHSYTVREVNGGKVVNGITYDNTVYTITTIVTHEGEGRLSVKHEVEGDKEVVFNNTYKADPTAVVIGASKKLENKELTDGQFTFELKDADGNLVGKAKQNNAKGQVKFDTITYDKEGVYEYTVEEINDGQDKVTYDESKYSVKVTVKDNGKGSYTAEVTYPKGTPSFVNVYEKPAEPGTVSGDDGSNGTKTGDGTPVGLLAILLTLALAGGTAALLMRRQHSGNKR